MHKNTLIRASVVGALLVFSATSTALGQTPTVKQLYQMLLNQQKQIQSLQRRAAKAERELRNARRQLRQNQGNTAVTKKSVIDAQNAAAAARAAARQANAAIVKIRRDGTRVAAQRGLVITYARQDGARAFASIIALKPSHDLLGFGVLSADGGTPATLSGSRLISANTSFAPGVRAGFGYGFGESGVDARVMFTYLHGDWRTNASVSAPASILSVLVNPAATPQDDAFSARARYQFSYFVADMEAAQNLQVGQHLTLRLLAGLRVARIEEELNVLYQGRNFGPQGNRVVLNNRFTGIGPRVGVDTMWRVFRSFYVAANFDASLLLGNFTFRTRETFLDGGFQISSLEQKQKGVIVPTVGARLAFGWNGPISKGVTLVVEVGYEFQTWFGAARNINNVDDVNGATLVRQTSNLLLHGPFLSIKFKIDNLSMMFGR